MLDHFSETGFFLEAHAHRHLLVVLAGGELTPGEVAELGRVAGMLAGAGARLAFCFQEEEGLRARLEQVCASWHPLAHRWRLEQEPREVGWLWTHHSRVVLAGVEAESQEACLDWLVRLATSLRAGRLVLARGGGGGVESLPSYMTPRRLSRLLREGGGGQGMAPLLRTAFALLEGGVGAVSLCRAEVLGQELFTYEGSGTFLARHHYCRVRPLELDDFTQAAAVIRRGEREGYLLHRSQEQVWEVLVGGYGAFLAGDRLAGVCGLLTRPYREEGVGELCSLYTLTRFTGEGVAGHLLRRMRQDARKAGLEALFACTTNPHVVTFFQHHGYRVSNRIPEAKWRSYDPGRRERVTCMRLELER